MQSSVEEAPAPRPTILVVEDDVLVRTALAQYLRETGLSVLEAVHVEEAVAILGANPSVQAIFSDVRLPGPRNGLDLARLVRAEYPHVKVLLTSGVLPLPEVKDVAFLRKPYFLFDVERRLKEMIGAPVRS